MRSEFYNGASIEINNRELEKVLKEAGINNFYTQSLEEQKFSQIISCYFFELPPEAFPPLLKYVQDNFEGREKASAEKKIKQFTNLLSSFKTKVPKNLPDFATTLRLKIKEEAFSYALVELDKDGNRVIKRVKGISYQPYNARTEEQAYVSVELSYSEFGASRRSSFSIYQDDLAKSLEEILSSKNYELATEEDYEEYKKKYERYCKIHDAVGKQFVTTQKLNVRKDRDYSYERVTLLPGSRVVVDTKDDDVIRMQFEYPTFFKKEDTTEAEPLKVFDSCRLRMFSLDHHQNLDISVDYLEDYKYNDDIAEDLVIPQSTLDCLDIILRADSYKFADVVDNKSGGVIVLSSGPAGCGKTLTAQVYSELIHKPLYSVQSSQLGLDTEEIEKNLTKILNRASKWKAVLLIDEADVFIRRRGDDLNQNAIVGVFLRVLESFEGILFFTTNRFLDNKGEQFVDDAILSRCTCHLRYNKPNSMEQETILMIQARKMGLKVSLDACGEIIDLLKDYSVSGRDIRNIVKLSMMFLKKDGGKELTAEVVERVLPFHSTLRKD